MNPRLACLSATVALAFAASGCSDSPLAPGGDAAPPARISTGVDPLGLEREDRGQAFYPLEPGSRWDFRTVLRVQLFPSDGSEPPPPIEEVGSAERELICGEPESDRSYVVERSRRLRPGLPPSSTWVRYRQDHSGLYERDVPVTRPPECDEAEAGAASMLAGADLPEAQPPALAPDGAAVELRAAYEDAWQRLRSKLAVLGHSLGRTASPASRPAPRTATGHGEITRLRYPLHPGSTWAIRQDPHFAAQVEGVESLPLPPGRVPGFRLRVTSELFDQRDVVHLWYGRAGFLGLRAHMEAVVTDPYGNPIGVVVAESSEELTAVQLPEPGRF